MVPRGRVRGSRNVLPRMLDLIERALPPHAERLRFGIIEMGAPARRGARRAALRERCGERDVYISPATPVIATHTGPGTWGIAYSWRSEGEDGRVRGRPRLHPCSARAGRRGLLPSASYLSFTPAAAAACPECRC